MGVPRLVANRRVSITEFDLIVWRDKALKLQAAVLHAQRLLSEASTHWKNDWNGQYAKQALDVLTNALK